MTDKQKLNSVADLVKYAIDHYWEYLYNDCYQKQVSIKDVVTDLREIQTIINKED